MDNSEQSTAGRSGPSRILVVDDHPLFREALSRMLSRQSALNMVGEAANGREAVELCRRLRPDLVLMDVRMPEMDGLEATRAIKREFPRTVVLILTSFENPSYLLEALKAGASGYVLKYAAPEQVIDAIRRVLRGESPLDQEVSTQLLMRLINDEPEQEPADIASRATYEGRSEPPVLDSLSQRELDILRLLALGQNNQEIARNLLVSVSTVKKHVQRILAKLEVSDRVQAAIRANELGLLSERDR